MAIASPTNASNGAIGHFGARGLQLAGTGIDHMVIRAWPAGDLELLQKSAEPGHNKTKSHKSQPCANPGKKRSLGREIVAQVSSLPHFFWSVHFAVRGLILQGDRKLYMARPPASPITDPMPTPLLPAKISHRSASSRTHYRMLNAFSTSATRLDRGSRGHYAAYEEANEQVDRCL
jgi:hypothetical protein